MESSSDTNESGANSLAGTATGSLQLDECRRSAARLPMSIPVILKGTDAAGRSFIEHAHTVLINKTGFAMVSKQALAVGGRLQIALPSRQRVSWATIAWLGEKKAAGQEVGIALEQTDDFWGVQFPADSLDSNPRQLAAQQEGGLLMQESLPLAGNQDPRHQIESTAQAGPREAQFGSSDKLSGVLRELADNAIKETLQEALKVLSARADEIQTRASSDFAMQLQGRVEQALSVAMERLEARASEIISRNQRDWEQNLESLRSSAEDRLRAQVAEQEKCLVANVEKIRDDLAQKLADASSVLNGNRDLRA